MNRIIETDDGPREILGFVSVDSGQVVIADPCYIDSHWKREQAGDDRSVFRRLYRHRDSGAELQYQRDFGNYQEPIASQGGLTMNELNATGEWDRVPNPRAKGLSYLSACSATMGDGDGQLVEPCIGGLGGHFAIGVASDTGYGDGTYPVIVERAPDGRVARLIVDFLMDDAGIGEDEADRLPALERELVDGVVASADAETPRKAA
jgi:hypothetical protein